MSSDEQVEIIRRGAWLSLDGVKDNAETIKRYVDFLTAVKNENLLHKTLLSQDAYWSVISEEGTISFKRFGSPYTAMVNVLIPTLKDAGFSEEEIDQLLVRNPANAYSIEVCKL